MNLEKIINEIKSKNILVIGDIMLDNYYIGSSSKISPEAPVAVLLEKENKFTLGGVGNVALNLIAAGQKVSIMSVIGNDQDGIKIESILDDNNINKDLLLKDNNMRTIVKTRFIGQNNLQMFRFDQEISYKFDDKKFNSLMKKLEKVINNFDIIIVSDYNKGFLTVDNTPKIIELANKYDKKILIDIKEPVYSKYNGAYLIKPNINELKDITKMPVNNFEQIVQAGNVLLKKTSSKNVLVTLGADGMVLIDKNGNTKINCVSREVFDVTGAGDTVISYLAVGLANLYDLLDSCYLSSYASGVKVSKMGTYAVKLSDILDYMGYVDYTKKIVSIKEIEKILKNNKKSIVFTNGCFDIFHVGHLRYLKETSKYADMMIIGLNSDVSVKKLKGENRPIVCESERAELLAALDFVDYVVLFDTETPYDLVKIIKPDVMTKGGDYKPENIAGANFAKKVVIIPLVDGKSTTNIVDKILKVYSNE